ncbi:MAG: hypothetical protein LZ167_05395 [Thaumarchaeota archaeon]|nr:hypothetical protein [Candidatus Geocrenenecus arthurdayi]
MQPNEEESEDTDPSNVKFEGGCIVMIDEGALKSVMRTKDFFPPRTAIIQSFI